MAYVEAEKEHGIPDLNAIKKAACVEAENFLEKENVPKENVLKENFLGKERGLPYPDERGRWGA